MSVNEQDLEHDDEHGPALRARAIESLLIDKGLLTADMVDRITRIRSAAGRRIAHRQHKQGSSVLATERAREAATVQLEPLEHIPALVNILLTVRGRRSGTPRTTPLSMLELDGRRFVQASYSEDGWVRNLRAAGQATITDHGRRIAVQTVELPPEKAAAIIRRALEPYRRSRLLRVLLGPRVRPPVAVLRWVRIRVDEKPEEYLAEARRHPLFELRSMVESTG